MKVENWEREIAMAIVESLVDYGISGHLAQYGEHNTEDWVEDCCLGAMGFDFLGGATKTCISHYDLDDWIIKVSYTENVARDYARVEYENYYAAVEAGLQYYFPHTEFLCEMDGLNFYIQQRAMCDENMITSDWYEKVEARRTEDGEDIDPDYIWDEIWCMEDEERADLSFGDYELTCFLQSHNIGDLHEGNLGYIGDHLVIVDFSGYMG